MKEIDYRRRCLLCGNVMEEHFDEYNGYYDCNCELAIKTKDITKQIRILRDQIPKDNYEIINSSRDDVRWMRRLNKGSE